MLCMSLGLHRYQSMNVVWVKKNNIAIISFIRRVEIVA